MVPRPKLTYSAAATAGGHTTCRQTHDRAQQVQPVDDAGAVDGRRKGERPPTAPWKTPSNHLASSTSPTRPSSWPV